jgi:hypothetical protein
MAAIVGDAQAVYKQGQYRSGLGLPTTKLGTLCMTTLIAQCDIGSTTPMTIW